MTRAFILGIGISVACAAHAPLAGQAPAAMPDLVSSWTLVGFERGVNSGQPTRVQGARGLLIVDRAGVQRTFANYGGFWGRYEVNAAGDRMTITAEDGVSPSVAGKRFSRSYAFEGDIPTTEEGLAALKGYIGYFGTVGVYPGEVFHNLLAGVSPGAGSILRRYAEISGDELTVRLQGGGPNPQGQQIATVVILKRLSGEADMLPRTP